MPYECLLSLPIPEMTRFVLALKLAKPISS